MGGESQRCSYEELQGGSKRDDVVAGIRVVHRSTRSLYERAQHELSSCLEPRTSYDEARANHPQDDEALHHVLGTDQEKANGVGEIAYHQPYE